MKDLSAEWVNFMKDQKNAAETEKVVTRLKDDEARASLRLLENKKAEILYSEKGQAEKDKEIALIAKEIASTQKKLKLGSDELWLIEARANAVMLEKKAREKGLSEKEAETLKNYRGQVDAIDAKNKAQEEAARIAAENAEKEKQKIAAEMTEYEEKKRKEAELAAARKKAAEDMARDFKNSMKEKEDAIKSLADIDDKMRIRSLEGEEKKLEELKINYEKQVKEIEALHEKELFNVKEGSAAKEEIEKKQNDRLEEMKRLHEQESQAIRDEYAEKEKKMKEATAKKIADIDDQIRVRYLTEEEKKLEGLKNNYDKQKEEITALHEHELIGLEEGSLAKAEIEAAQANRMREIDKAYQEEKEEVQKEYHDREQKRLAADRDRKLAAVASSLQGLQQLTEGQKKYAGIFKAAALAEAGVNAAQAILTATKAAPPPFNIPLIAVQTALAMAQVQKIATAKMYLGGMIPGKNTLIMANEDGREAILNPMAVRAVGGPAGVNALNQGTNNYSYDNSQSQNNTIVINTTLLSQKTLRDDIEPALRWQQRRL
jgi:hypothetical protein